MDYFNSLPSEIQLDILSRVPAESLFNDSKQVCKTWNDLVRHPSLPRLHLYRVNHDDYESTTPIQRIRRINLKTPFYCTTIVGSCNGLICLDGHPSLYICNPITREQVMLPEIQIFYIRKYFLWTSWFGYVPSTNEYKIIGIRKYYLQPKIAEVHIYTLGSGTGWRSLGKFNIDFGLGHPVRGIFANGTLNWIGQNSEMIITFDLAEEIFIDHLSTPPLPPNGNRKLNRIGILDGFFCFFAWLDEGYDCADIWLLENKNDMKEREDLQSLGWSWTKKFKLKDMSLVTFTKSGGVLTDHYNKCLNIYDPKTSISKSLVHYMEMNREIFPHKNTLVSLKQLGEEDPLKLRKRKAVRDSPL